MKIHLAGGFLGSGKTTAIRGACALLLRQDIKVAVVTNDQGVKLVDGLFFDSLDIPARQVVNGCFCCNYNDLDSNITSLMETDGPAVVFAESVGSCTDIIATVLKPLSRFHPTYKITVSIFADACLLLRLIYEETIVFSEDISYIYFKQLEEANIIIVNKADLLGISQLEKLKQVMGEKYPDKKILYQNALEEKDIAQWLHILDETIAVTNAPLQIDYDIYGSGEAKLAWLDQDIDIHSHTNNAVQEAIAVIQGIYDLVLQSKYAIGHLKFLLNGKSKFSFTSTPQPEMRFDDRKEKAFSSSLLINARVETDPKSLAQLVATVCRKVQAQTGCSIEVKTIAAFKPGYPRPTYRMTN